MPRRTQLVKAARCLLAITTLAAALLAATPAQAAGGIITTVAGGGVGDGGGATSANLNRPYGVATDGLGNLYIADTFHCLIREVTGATITTVAGNGTCGFGGDGGPATSASLYNPRAVAVNAAGDVYLAEPDGSCRVRKVSLGTITTVAGDGVCAYSGDSGAATSAGLNVPYGVAVDATGNVYIADWNECRVRMVSGGIITTAAGTGTCGFGGDGGDATSAALGNPAAVAVDGSGNLYIALYDSCRVRKVSAGKIATVAGDGSCGVTYSGDGGPAVNAGFRPAGVAVDMSGNLYIADNYNCRVREVIGTTITTVAGGSGYCYYSGDGGPATSASLTPAGVAAGVGDLYIADSNNCRVRRVTGGTITTAAGNGNCGFGYSGDGGAATSASLNYPAGVTVDDAGNIYIADGKNCRVREVSDGKITTVAGNGGCYYGGDGSAAISAGLDWLVGIAVDAAGSLYLADATVCRIRQIAGGMITTAAGLACGYGGDGGAATSARLSLPNGVAIDAVGNVYIADTGNCRVREVSAGKITTVAGSGLCHYGDSGDGGAATSAILAPAGVAVDGAGNLYIADSDNCRIRKVTAGIITTVAGSGACPQPSGGDGGPATSASLLHPTGVAVDGFGNLYIADRDDCRVRKVSGGIITTVAGDGSCAYGGDGGAATSASLDLPSGVATDGAGNLYIADTNNHRIRKVTFVVPLSVGGVSQSPDLRQVTARPSSSRHASAYAIGLLALAAGGWVAIRRRRLG